MVALSGVNHAAAGQKRAGDKRTQFLITLNLLQIHHRRRRLVITKKTQDLLPIVLIVHCCAEKTFAVLIFIFIYGNRRVQPNQAENTVGILLGHILIFRLQQHFLRPKRFGKTQQTMGPGAQLTQFIIPKVQQLLL